MLIIPSFKKTLIVEQFQGNYLQGQLRSNDNHYFGVEIIVELCHIHVFAQNVTSSRFSGMWLVCSVDRKQTARTMRRKCCSDVSSLCFGGTLHDIQKTPAATVRAQIHVNKGIPGLRLDKKQTTNSWKRHMLCDSMLTYGRNRWEFEHVIRNSVGKEIWSIYNDEYLKIWTFYKLNQ